ncbi:O-methyltransferase [Streptomyces albus]
MFEAAEHDGQTAQRAGIPHSAGGDALTAQQLADAAQDIYMPVSAEGGRLLYNLVRATRPSHVVEFGTSYGISALHLAAAVRDNGVGHVITTEMSRSKAAAARRTFAATGLDDVITLLEGDALRTLAELDTRIGFLFLDGWKDLCLPVLRLLEPHLAPGTLVWSPTTSNCPAWPPTSTTSGTRPTATTASPSRWTTAWRSAAACRCAPLRTTGPAASWPQPPACADRTERRDPAGPGPRQTAHCAGKRRAAPRHGCDVRAPPVASQPATASAR